MGLGAGGGGAREGVTEKAGLHSKTNPDAAVLAQSPGKAELNERILPPPRKPAVAPRQSHRLALRTQSKRQRSGWGRRPVL